MDERVVLLFHSLSRDTFCRLAAACDAEAGNVVSPDEFFDGSRRRKVLLTFDDGYERSDHRICELLRSRSLRALAFVIPMTGGMDRLRFDWKYYADNSDVFEVGSHSMSHSKLYAMNGSMQAAKEDESIAGYGSMTYSAVDYALVTREWLPLRSREESFEEYVLRLRSDLWMSKNIVERRLGRECRFFAYPWGQYNRTLKGVVSDTGYAAAFTTTETDGDRFTIPRIPVT